MIAFHGKKSVKDFYVARVAGHEMADEIVQSYGYWKDGRGCGVGCSVHSDQHSSYENELGIPVALAYLEDGMFEAMPKEEARTWPLRFLEAIPVGADLSLVPKQYLVWMLRDLLTIGDLAADVRTGVEGMAVLMENSLRGDEPSETEWSEAERAAWDARDARAAWAAWDAARATHALRHSEKLLELLAAAPVTVTA